jgi:hypothetical protein
MSADTYGSGELVILAKDRDAVQQIFDDFEGWLEFDLDFADIGDDQLMLGYSWDQNVTISTAGDAEDIPADLQAFAVDAWTHWSQPDYCEFYGPTPEAIQACKIKHYTFDRDAAQQALDSVMGDTSRNPWTPIQLARRYDDALSALEIPPNGDDYNAIMALLNGGAYEAPTAGGR